MTLINERVQLAQLGQNQFAITRMPSGWLVIGDVQPLPGYCLLLADPVVPSINDLTTDARIQYSLDMIRIGDALLAATGAYRINYETLGNSEPALHTHIVPRYMSEPEAKRRQPAFVSYDWSTSPKYDAQTDGPLMARLRAILAE